MFGLIWSKEDLIEKKEGSNTDTLQEPPDKVMFPLSLLLRPEIWQMLKQVFHISDGKNKEGMPHVPGDAVSMFTQSKDEFLKNMGMGDQKNSDTLQQIINKSNKDKNKTLDEYPALKPSRPRKLGD